MVRSQHCSLIFVSFDKQITTLPLGFVRPWNIEQTLYWATFTKEQRYTKILNNPQICLVISNFSISPFIAIVDILQEKLQSGLQSVHTVKQQGFKYKIIQAIHSGYMY